MSKLWVDEYRPKRLKHISYHKEQAKQLAALKACGDFPHLLFYGPSGAGKKTRVMAFLRELFGEAAMEKLRFETITATPPSGAAVEIRALASNYHVDITPCDCGFHDRLIIQQVIKSMASTCRLDASSDSNTKFKVVVMNEVDKLSKDAQHALRRTMEKYVASCRVILIANSTSKVIPAIRSRCLAMRVPAPTPDQMLEVLAKVAKKEGLNLPSRLADQIIVKSQRNMRRALLMLETCKVNQYPFHDDQVVSELPWETYLNDTAKMALMEYSHQRLLTIRERLYELQLHLIPSSLVFKYLVDIITSSVAESLKGEVAALAAHCEHRMQLGTKQIFHLESFIISFMSIHQQYNEKGLLDELDFSSDLDMD